MSQRKHCSYKGCTSKQSPGVASNITFFQFPRDEHRYKIWMKLSQCENKDASVKYLCSKHFDARKYISKNPRRLLLLASAVPYPFTSASDNEDNENTCGEGEEENPVVTSQFADEDFIIQNIDTDFNPTETEDADCSYAESTINEVEYVHEDHPKSYEFSQKRRKWESDVESTAAIKVVKADESQSYQHVREGNSMIKSTLSKRDRNEIGESSGKIEQPIEQEVITNPNITTFIFKGEEYIQMPKRVYIQEKSELVSSVQYYKGIVLNIKSHIDDVKL